MRVWGWGSSLHTLSSRVHSVICFNAISHGETNQPCILNAMALALAKEHIPLRTDASGVIRIAGTRVPLETVTDSFNAGASPEEIVLSYPSLQLADVYAVITYYLRNRAEVDSYVAKQEKTASEAREHHKINEASRQVRERLLIRRALQTIT